MRALHRNIMSLSAIGAEIEGEGSKCNPPPSPRFDKVRIGARSLRVKVKYLKYYKCQMQKLVIKKNKMGSNDLRISNSARNGKTFGGRWLFRRRFFAVT